MHFSIRSTQHEEWFKPAEPQIQCTKFICCNATGVCLIRSRRESRTPPPWRKAASLLSLSKFLQTKFCCSDTFCCFKACALNPFTPQFYQKSCPSLQTCKSVDCVSQCSWKYGMHCRMTALCLLCGVFSLYTCQLTSENDQNENVFILRTWPLPGVCLSQKKIFEPECKYLICNWQ